MITFTVCNYIMSEKLWGEMKIFCRRRVRWKYLHKKFETKLVCFMNTKDRNTISKLMPEYAKGILTAYKLQL